MSGWTPLESSWAKFHRAGTHLDDLAAEMKRISDDPEAVTVERQIHGDEACLRVTRVPLLRDAGLMLGDAVSGYRAALDHLAWDLVKLGSHARLTSNQAMKVQYPLARSWVSLRNQRDQRVPGIASEEFAIIRAYQPYRRDDRGRAMRLLRQLSDTDKHRYIYPAFIAAVGFAGQVRLVNCSADGIWMRRPKRALDVGVKLVRVHLVDAAPEHDVQIESQITLQPSLGHGIALGPALGAVRTTVLEVLTRFEGRLV